MNGRARKIASSNARRLRSTIQRVEQQPYDLTSGRRAPRTAGAGGGGWCQLGSTLAAATGTWPSLTPGSASSVTIYRSVNGSLVALQGTFTVYNWWPTSMAASKRTRVFPCGDGTWEVEEQAC